MQVLNDNIVSLLKGEKGDKGEPSPGIQNITVEEASFGNMSWSEIAEISESGKANEYFAVGDEKTIELTTGETITVVIWGFDHDDLSDGTGKAGMTIGMKGHLDEMYEMNEDSLPDGTNAGGWDECDFRTETIPVLFSQLPSDLQSAIKQVNKKATAGSQSTTIVTSVDKLFLFSETEIDGFDGNASGSPYSGNYDEEGEQYEYWKSVKDGTKGQDLKDYFNPGGYGTWTRSPHQKSDGGFIVILGNGDNVLNGRINAFKAWIPCRITLGFCV